VSGPSGAAPPRAWFERPVLDVARDLLGARLTVRRSDGRVTVRVTEVEAYGGADDPGSHAYRGRTARNAVMFGPPGHLYVYRHLGLHHCANVVTGPVGEPTAVLLRAGEVVDGTARARARRMASGVVRRDVDLARGPARLVVALGLTGADDGLDLLGADVELAPAAVADADVARGGRVGVAGPGGDATRFPWRLWLDGDPAVSAYRRG
jgi:DNA-3-methyladenine glycosylase